MKKFIQDSCGAMHITTLLICVIVAVVALGATEVFRVQGIHEHLQDELYRASNVAIKAAMYDSYRIDGVSRFDESKAVEAFYDYLYNDLGLNSSIEKWEQGELVYRLKISDIKVNGQTTRMTIDGVAYADTSFNLINQKWEVPVAVTSRNMRVD